MISYTVRDYVWLVMKYLIVGLVIGGLGVILYASFFKDPETSRLQKELKYMDAQVKGMQEQMDTLDQYLNVLQKRDNEIYRTIFGASPIERKYVGGNRYNEMMRYSTQAGIVETQNRLMAIEQNLVQQSKSYQEIMKLAKKQDQFLSALPAIQPVDNRDLKRMASGFGFRIHPIYRVARMHTGLDFAAPIGTEIYATGDGVIKSPDGGSGYGLHIVIDHGFGYQTLYAHMSRLAVTPGTKVKRGQIIGYVGNTGVSSGPHLHYEVIKNGEKVNPAYYFYNDLTPDQYAALLERASQSGQSFD